MIYFLFASLGGIVCSLLAVARARSGIGWFAIGFLIPIIGLILILVLPNRATHGDALGPFQIQQQNIAAQRAKQDRSLDALSRLAELKDRGALTAAEFEEKKSELLANI